MFVLQNAPRAAARAPGPDLEPAGFSRWRRRRSSTSTLPRGGERRGRLRGAFEYATDLFDAATIERMVGTRGAVEGGGADPGVRLSSCRCWPRPSGGGCSSSGTRPASRTRRGASTRCSGQVARGAGRGGGDVRGRVSELRGARRPSNQLARTCASLGWGRRRWWGSAWSARWRWWWGLLGILKAGGAYVPLDPEYPPERLALHARGRRGAGVADAGAVCGGGCRRSGREVVMPGRGSGRRLAAESKRGAGDRGGAGAPGLRDLHLGLDGGAQGGGGTPPRGVATVVRGGLRELRAGRRCSCSWRRCQLRRVDAGAVRAAAARAGGVCSSPGGCRRTRELGEVLASAGSDDAVADGVLVNAVVDELPQALAGVQQLLIGGEALSVAHVQRGSGASAGDTAHQRYGPTEDDVHVLLPAPAGA